MSNSVGRAALRALRAGTVSRRRVSLAPVLTVPNVIPDPVQTGDYGPAATPAERRAFVGFYRKTVTWRTSLSLRWLPGGCPVTPAYCLKALPLPEAAEDAVIPAYRLAELEAAADLRSTK